MISATQRLLDDETYSLNLPIHWPHGEDHLTKPAGSSVPTAIKALLLSLVNRILACSSRSIGPPRRCSERCSLPTSRNSRVDLPLSETSLDCQEHI